MLSSFKKIIMTVKSQFPFDSNGRAFGTTVSPGFLGLFPCFGVLLGPHDHVMLHWLLYCLLLFLLICSVGVPKVWVSPFLCLCSSIDCSLPDSWLSSMFFSLLGVGTRVSHSARLCLMFHHLNQTFLLQQKDVTIPNCSSPGPGALIYYFPSHPTPILICWQVLPLPQHMCWACISYCSIISNPLSIIACHIAEMISTLVFF